MTNNTLNYDNTEEILKLIQKIILDNHPIVDDRINLLYPSFNEPRTPEMDINFIFYKNGNNDYTQILFMDGTSIYKEIIPDRLEINGLISKKVICNLISYLLTDHDYFKNIYINATSIELPMDVNGYYENMHGISCGEITLKFDFSHHPDFKSLLNEYLQVIIINFYEKLKNTITLKNEFKNYFNSVKSEFINSLTTEELKDFINLLSHDDLCNLIYSIPNMRFIELYNEYNKHDNIKKLTKV